MGCGSSEPSEELVISEIDSISADNDTLCADSLMSMAQRAIVRFKRHEDENRTYVDSLASAVITTKQLSQEDKHLLSSQLREINSQNQVYQEELSAYKTRRVVTKDTIVYRIKFVDSVVKRTDTVIVYDTIVKTIFKKRNRQ